MVAMGQGCISGWASQRFEISILDFERDLALICHGMIDNNIHFQDIVRLAQKLIKLGKDNWELAVFPLETHSFIPTKICHNEIHCVYFYVS